MKTTYRLILAVVALAFVTIVQAQFNYTTDGQGNITITKYTGSGGAVVIPDTINGLPVISIGVGAFLYSSVTSITIPNSVTTIGDSAFTDCISLTNISLGNSITTIGDHAFAGCDGLTSVTIPNRVTTIRDSAFIGCISLTSVTIPNSVTSIGEAAFRSCGSLTAITVDTTNPVYRSVDGVLFNKSQTTLIKYPEGKAGSYSIPNGVTSIRPFAVAGCASLTSVTIPTSITSIGTWAFFGSSLTSVTIPTSITSIEPYAFRSCRSLTSITIPKSITSLGDQAFYDCTSLTGIYFWGNAPSLGGSSVFTGDSLATVYYLPGTTGWGQTYGGRPTKLWNPTVITTTASFGVWMGRFGFPIVGTDGLIVVVDACTNLANPIWAPVGTNTLNGGSSYFSDWQWTNYPARFYRIRSP